MPRITKIELQQQNAALAAENAKLRAELAALRTKPAPLPTKTLTMEQRREYVAAFPNARSFTPAMYYAWKASTRSSC